ncbi:hypothetical protein CCP2SC5_340003 [Azospirillaceae bacterium]
MGEEAVIIVKMLLAESSSKMEVLLFLRMTTYAYFISYIENARSAPNRRRLSL